MPSSGRERMELVLEAGPGDLGLPLSLVIARASGLSRRRVKEAMVAGAVWRERGRSRRRVRRASEPAREGERIRLCWDPAILGRTVPDPGLVADRGAYSVWDKPPGMPTQGTLFGDHLALERRVGRLLPGRPVRLVHRLDREAGGLVVVAHDAGAAAALARQFRERSVEKVYLARVRGLPAQESVARIETPIDGREAITRARVLHRDPEREESLLEVRIGTGRRHQIRRHLAALGHPVMGDPLYGRGNADPGGLRLRAVGLAFVCPRSGVRVRFALPCGWASGWAPEWADAMGPGAPGQGARAEEASPVPGEAERGLEPSRRKRRPGEGDG